MNDLGVNIRRHFLLDPGEGFLLTSDLFDFVDRFREFMDTSGLTDTQIVVSPLVAMPIPAPEARAAGARPWAAVNAEVMWHPFFWLPDEVAARAVIADSSGDRPESDEEYLVRVMAQCAVAGIFDVETGTWLDVLAHAGLDSAAPDTLTRVRSWQLGESDHLLDAINLSELFAEAATSSDVIAQAIASTPDTVRGQWALTADYIGRSIREMQSASPQPERDEFAEILGTLMVLAYSGFAGGELIGDTETRAQVQGFIIESQNAGTNVAELASLMLELCARVYLMQKPILDKLGTEAEEAEQAAATTAH